MTTAYLRPCPGCSRHVRVSEGACPFCGTALDSSFRAAPVRVPPSSRLARATLFALGTGAAALPPLAALDCSSDGYAVLPPYGHSPLYDAGEEAQDSALDAGDSAAEDAGSPARDGGPDAGTDGS